MADVKISAATDIVTLHATDKVPVARSASTVAYSATATELQAFTNTTPAGTTSTDLPLTTGNASAGNSGSVTLTTGTATGTRGNVTFDAAITVVVNGQLQSPTGVEFDIGTPSNGGASNTGNAFLFSGDQTGTGQSGTVGIQSGNATGNNTGPCFIGTGNSTGANSAQTTIFSGDGHATGGILVGTGNASAGNSGSITLQTGTATGTRGNVTLDGLLVLLLNLPTVAPATSGAVWRDAGAGNVLKVVP